MPLLRPRMSLARRTPFSFVAPDQPMSFRAPVRFPPAHARPVGVRINAAVVPGSSPRCAADEHRVRTPVEASNSPAPRAKSDAQSNAEPPPNRAAHKKPRPRRPENDERIVGGHINKAGIDRINRDVRPSAHYDLTVASQIPIILRLLPHALHRVHHILLLRQERIA